MSDPTDDSIKPWTVKGITPKTRAAAIAAADRADQKIGEWLEGAIKLAIAHERTGKRLRQPELIREPLDLGSITALVAVTTQLSAASQQPPPASLTKAIYSQVRRHLRTKPAGLDVQQRALDELEAVAALEAPE